MVFDLVSILWAFLRDGLRICTAFWFKSVLQPKISMKMKNKSGLICPYSVDKRCIITAKMLPVDVFFLLPGSFFAWPAICTLLCQQWNLLDQKDCKCQTICVRKKGNTISKIGAFLYKCTKDNLEAFKKSKLDLIPGILDL